MCICTWIRGGARGKGKGVLSEVRSKHLSFLLMGGMQPGWMMGTGQGRRGDQSTHRIIQETGKHWADGF